MAIRFPDGMIIAFEGLDCSFKETNYKAAVNMIQNGFKYLDNKYVFTESFPRYGTVGCTGVESWLRGRLDRGYMMQHPASINSLYCIDRLHYWHEWSINENGKKYSMYDMLNCNLAMFIFDRYTLSNAFYNPIYDDERVTLEDIRFDKDVFDIPLPHVVVWMRMRNFEVLKSLLAKKENKDENEIDTDFIYKVWKRSERAIKDKSLWKKAGIKLIVIDCLNEDNTIKSKEEIEFQVTMELGNAIAEYKKND